MNNDFKKVSKLLSENFNSGFSLDDIINTLFYLVRTNNSISEVNRIEFIKEISVSGININDGVDGIIPIYSIASRLWEINKN